jgi:hypothetical protein
MRIVHVVFACMVVSVPAFALEVRETRTQLVFDVPSAWVVSHQGEYVRARAPDRHFTMALSGLEEGHPTYQAPDAEKFLLDGVRFSGWVQVTDVKVDVHARAVTWGNLAGFETFGTGKMTNDYDTTFAPCNWMAVLLMDKTDPKKAVRIVGIGTPAGYTANEPGIYTALHSLHPAPVTSASH